MNEMIILYITGGMAGIIVLVFIIGLLLPKERVVTRQSLFCVTPEVLYDIVTNNEDWHYRTDVDKLIIIEKKSDCEIWEETTSGGAVIRFTTREKKPHSFYSFNMESKLFSGYWTGTFEPVTGGKTLFTATEHISVKNPFIKTLSYFLFNIGKLMENYQNHLKNKVNTEHPMLN